MNTIKVKVLVYVLTDVNGKTMTDVVDDCSDHICLHGTGNDGKCHQFDSYEAYHSYDWAARLGMKVDCYEKELEIVLNETGTTA